MSAVLKPLPADDGAYELVPMLTTSRAVDLFLGDFTRKSRSKNGSSTRSYRRILDLFTDTLRADKDVTEITVDDCRRFLDSHLHLGIGTQAQYHGVLNSFFTWLDLHERIKKNPLDRIPGPRRIASEDLDVLSVSTEDVRKLLAACETPSELIAISILVYLGPRRGAVALLRLRDYDQRPYIDHFDDHGNPVAATKPMMRFYEKGSKTIWKPVPDELASVLDAAIASGLLVHPDDYLVPPEGPLARGGDRDDRVIWRLVKRVAANAGVEAHVHALRAAFATYYLETFGNDLVGLQELMGHRNIETTRGYLRKLDKQQKMEQVRGLSWAGVGAENAAPTVSPLFAGDRFPSSLAVGAGGFEPPNQDAACVDAAWSETGAETPPRGLDEALTSEARWRASLEREPA